MKTLLVCASLVIACSLPSLASAQPLHVVVEGLGESAALGEGLSADLGQPVSVGTTALPLLRIVLREGRATLVYATVDGERVREIDVPAAEDEAVEILVLVASNLVRDQTSGLIAESSPQTPAAPPAPEVAEPPLLPEAPLDFALSHPLHLGLSAIFGVSTSANPSPFFTFGLSVAGTVHPHLTLGVTRLNVSGGASSIEGVLLAAGGTPMLEAYGFLDPHVQVHGRVGVALQGRTQSISREGVFQVAPTLGAGIRFWLTNWLTLGVDFDLHLVVTDAYLIGDVELPQWSLPGTLGASLEFHIDP